MTAPVEAHSLSSLTALFANPPQYPRNPTHEVREPLVLYIVRVPGSKDVFLTPLKPPTKTSISLEAIQSCLYYLHVVTPEDELLRRSLDEQKHLEELESRSPPVARKPLPTVPFANYPPSARPPLPPKSYPHFQPPLNGNEPDTQTGRYAARGVHLRLNTSEENAQIRRKPIGPRSFQANQNVTDVGNIKLKPGEYTPDEVRGAPPLPPRSAPSRDSWGHDSVGQDENVPLGTLANATSMATNRQRQYNSIEQFDRGLPGNPGLKGGLGMPYREMEITLIRRDPSSGSQWNIGTVSFPTKTTDSFSEKCVTVELSAPGYQKFARQTDRLDIGAKTFTTAEEIKSLLSSQTTDSPVSITSETATTSVFTRQVQMQVRQESGDGQPPRRTSEEFMTSRRQNFSSPQKPRARPRFAFKSPWQGSCTFTTGMDGRSLKCRHTLSSITSSEDNLGADVAELRFNLPWLMLRPKDSSSRAQPSSNTQLLPTGHSSKESLKRGIQHLKNKSWSGGSSELDGNLSRKLRGLTSRGHITDADDRSDDDDRMDLKLGREKAGGGFKGRSAKLGKLVIEDEGLKMCDLIVGACMGIWWQQYMARTEDP